MKLKSPVSGNKECQNFLKMRKKASLTLLFFRSIDIIMSRYRTAKMLQFTD